MDIVPAKYAPDFNSNHQWINSPRIKLKELKNKVILIDCWTYTCIFCLRTIPMMKKLSEKYSNYGLRVILAHSSEYEFAKDVKNLEKAIEQYSIDLPVVADLDNKIWESYGNMYWPKHILIDQNGLIRFEHAGYGDIANFEYAIIELLKENNDNLSVDMEINNPKSDIYDTYGMHFLGIAPEICVGYTRLRRFGNNQRLHINSINNVVDTLPHQNNLVYLKGKWFWDKEGVISLHDSYEKNSSITMKYNQAKKVNVILGKTNDEKAVVELKVDGKYIPLDFAGLDVVVENDVSYLEVTWPHIYNLATFPNMESHEIEIIPKTGNIIVYTFIFG